MKNSAHIKNFHIFTPCNWEYSRYSLSIFFNKMATIKKATKKAAPKKAAAKPAAKKAAAKPAAKKAAAKPAAKKAAPKKAAAKPAAKKAAPKKAAAKRKPNAAFMKELTPSPALAAVIGSKGVPRTGAVKKIWDYIKANKLQDAKNKRMINADAKLKPVFGGKAQVSMFDMAKFLSKHLS
ncbi:MAG: hypothetical protein KA143_03680 [Saprospiraceae bacterium]|nr:hypothetical protein [Saprospiraceae bacterium]